MANNIEKQSFGQAGATFEAGTQAHTGDYCAILIIKDATFTTLTWPELNTKNGVALDPAADAITGVIIPTGVTIYGQISSFAISDGMVLAYHAA